MNVQWSFKNCSGLKKSQIRSYWDQKQVRIERLLRETPGPRNIRISIYFYEDRVNQYEARAVLEVPGRSLAVQASEMMVNAVLDDLTDSLARSIRKYKNLVRHTYRQQRKERNSSDLDMALGILSADQKSNRKDSFFKLLRPLLAFLEEQAKRELKVLELEGSVRPGYITPEELVDEVVILAWENFSTRVPEKSLEHWLISLLHDLLQTIEWESSQFVSLDEGFDIQEIDRSAEPDWMEDVLGYHDKMTLAELVPNDEVTEAWGELSNEGQQLHIYTVLQGLPAFRRQAYLLHSVEEYTAEEIAHIQNRSVTDIESDIGFGRDTMHDHLVESGMIN